MAEDILKLMMMATYVILLTTTFITHPWLPRHILPTYTIFNLVLGPTPNMDYGKKKLMADDCLKTLKFVSSDVFQYKISKILLWLVLAIHGTITLVGTYFLLGKFNRKQFMNFVPSYLATFYPLLAIWTLLFRGELISNIKNEVEMWTIDSAGEKVHRQIKNQATFMTIFAVVNFLISIVGGCLYLVPLSEDVDTFVAFYLFHNYFPNQEKYLSSIYRMTFLMLGYFMIVHGYQIIYYSEHGRYQSTLLKEHVANLDSCERQTNEEKLFYDDEYQKRIHLRLVFCVKRSVKFVELIERKNREITNLIGVFSICGCLLGIGIVLHLLSGNLTEGYCLRLALLSIGTAAVFSALFWSGQTVEDQVSVTFREENVLSIFQSEEIVAALHALNWYNFDKNNKKIYLIMLTNAMQTHRVKFTENYSVNYDLGVQIVKSIYSIISVMVNMI
ncbi:uncharacterized protein [Tenebrio molitor]|uniref:uncharacterized protein isoform X3 n=1 Tax=Tenebrio molitor TaxID=7067 RepID=UPI0036247125